MKGARVAWIHTRYAEDGELHDREDKLWDADIQFHEPDDHELDQFDKVVVIPLENNE